MSAWKDAILEEEKGRDPARGVLPRLWWYAALPVPRLYCDLYRVPHPGSRQRRWGETQKGKSAGDWERFAVAVGQGSGLSTRVSGPVLQLQPLKIQWPGLRPGGPRTQRLTYHHEPRLNNLGMGDQWPRNSIPANPLEFNSPISRTEAHLWRCGFLRMRNPFFLTPTLSPGSGPPRLSIQSAIHFAAVFYPVSVSTTHHLLAASFGCFITGWGLHWFRVITRRKSPVSVRQQG